MAERAKVTPLRRAPAQEPLPRQPPPQEPLWREVLGHRLRALRVDQRETLSETAGRAGISPQYLSEVERGRKEPSSEMIAALAGALGTTLAELTGQVAGDLHRQQGIVTDLRRQQRTATDLRRQQRTATDLRRQQRASRGAGPVMLALAA
jgi:transcriptional regulator with XRE-family HTH domain